MKKKSQVKQMSIAQLNERLIELRKDLMKVNFQRSTGTVPENPGNIKQIRRNIARIHTFIKQKSNQQEVKTEKK